MSTPFKMRGFSGFANSSPLHNEKYVARQLKKAARLTKKAEKQEKKAAEAKAFTKEQYDTEEGSLFAFQPSGKRSRKRAEKAKAKAAAGSRKAYKKSKRQ